MQKMSIATMAVIIIALAFSMVKAFYYHEIVWIKMDHYLITKETKLEKQLELGLCPDGTVIWRTGHVR